MITIDKLSGHTAVRLENDNLRVAVLPSKGADIAEFHHRPSGVQFLMQTPDGLRPPQGMQPADFLENYEGGWQMLFPNANDGCEYRGQSIPFHGEVALLPWDYRILQDDLQASEISLQVRCQLTPFRLERRLRIEQGSSKLLIRDQVTNEAEQPWEFVWGQHLTLGGDFLEAGCRLELPARYLVTPQALFEPATARLAPAQNSPWPLALGRKPGEMFDLQEIPGPEAHSHDDAFLGDLEQGVFSLTNPRLGLRFRLEWDAGVFPWVTLWMPYGGADLPPLTGIYGVGVEPWVSRFPLAQAVAAGQALSLPPGASLEVEFSATVDDVLSES